jgi:acyl carrier protein
MALTTDAVHELICRVFSLPAAFEFSSELRPAFVPGWDSFGWIRLMMEIEQILSREIPVGLFDRVVTVDDFCSAVVEFSTRPASRSDGFAA